MREKERVLDKQIEKLRKQKKLLKLKQGEAYRCKNCNKIVMRNIFLGKKAENESLCYDCWSKELKINKRDELMQIIKDARVVDVVPEDNPYSSIYEAAKIIVETDKQRYELKPFGCYADEKDICINILETEEKDER